jgi:hypothetical protein
MSSSVHSFGYKCKVYKNDEYAFMKFNNANVYGNYFSCYANNITFYGPYNNIHVSKKTLISNILQGMSLTNNIVDASPFGCLKYIGENERCLFQHD